MAIKGTAVVALAGAGILLYAGIHGKSISSAIRTTLQGQSPASASAANLITGTTSNVTGPGNSGGIPNPSAHGGNASLNQAKARVMCVAYGWATGAEWAALVALWNRESNWNQYARNPTSGAYGIPQALPASKMGRLANPPFSSAVAQIRWGLSYIRGRYGNPVNAWAHEQSAGWY